MRCDEGQAVVDYIGLLAVLAVVFAIAVAVRVEPAALAGTIDRAFARGICVVRGGSCEADRQPCVVASEKLSRERHVNLVVASIGKDRYLLRERRSDGTIAITDFHAVRGSVGGSKGGTIRFVGIELGGEVSLSLLARHGSGATYVAGSQREADRLQRAIAAGDDLPAPAERFGETQTIRDYGAGGSIGEQAVADAGFHARDRDGTRVAADGSRTVVYEHGEGWDAGVLGMPIAARDRQESYAVRFDPSGRPLELVVSTGGELTGAADLPAPVAPAAAALLVASPARQRSYVVEAHLDLGDPVSAAIARDFVEQVRHPHIRVGSVLAPAQLLRDRIATEGTVEARAFAVERETLGSPEALGAGSSVSWERLTLLAAASRGYDGAWRSRDDCV
ncbi:MAG TPA: hypothetical protein VFB41_07715 [Solirubrobacteraceae bacterium]|nr:hypothetical protein [Solirubrobacteraceae bacterium]